MATLTTAPGFQCYAAFCATAGLQDDTDDPVIACNAAVISDDEDDKENDKNQGTTRQHGPHATDDEQAETFFPLKDEELHDPLGTHVTSSGSTVIPPAVDTTEEDKLPDSHERELLELHHRLGHLPMVQIQTMAKQGTMPK